MRILVVRIAAIGDVVMASTVIGRIRARSPDATIHWLCGAAVAPLVAQFEGVDAVIPVDEAALLRGSAIEQTVAVMGVWRRIAFEGYTRVVLLHVDPRYRVLVAPLVGATVSVLSRRDAHGLMNPLPGRYLGDEYARLVDGAAATGPVVEHASLARLRALPAPSFSPSTGRRRVALVPGGTKNVLRESALKRWPVDHYAATARALAEDGCDVVVVGDAGDDWVRPSFADIPVTDLIGRTSLVDTIATLGACDLVIAHDTGPMHLARLTRTPVIALFGPTPPAHFAPEDALTTVLWGGEHLACRPCYDGREFAACNDNQCMSSISPDVVIRTARTILAKSTRAIPDQPRQSTPHETAIH